MSVIIDMYRGNGGIKDSYIFLRKKKRCYMFRFFCLTIIKWDTDIFEEFGYLLNNKFEDKKY